MKQKLCVIGEALIDFIPQRKGCALKDVEGFTRVAGGAPANVAGAAARLGVPAMVLTQLGADAFGDYIIQSLKGSGIDTSHILQTKEHDTSLSFVSLREDGNRDFKFYRRTAADLQYSPDNITEDILDDCGMVHFCSVSLVDSPMKEAHRKLLDLATEKGILISFDPNLRLSLWNDDEALKRAVLEFLPYADILKLSDEELDNVAGGGCDTSVGGKSYTVVSSGLNCFTGQYEDNYRVTSVSFMIDSEPLNYEYDGPLYAPDNQKLRETWLSFTSLKEGKQQCGSCRWLSFKGGIGYCSKSGK